MRSFRQILFFQFLVIIVGVIILLAFSGFFTYKLSCRYERDYIERISSILSKNLKLITEISPNKYLIKESMRRSVRDVPGLNGMCLFLEKGKLCYPEDLDVKDFCFRRESMLVKGDKIFVCLPVYEEYASRFIGRKKIGYFFAIFNREYVEKFRNYWFLNALLISFSFITFVSLIIISLWIDIGIDFNRLKQFIDALRQPGKVFLSLNEKLNEFKIKEFRDVAVLIIRLTNRISRLSEYIKQLAITDPLTGLYNRNYLNLVVKENYIPLWKRKSFPMVVALLDVDDFKLINDVYGHQKGDEVLRRLGQIVKNSIRDSDIPIRYGGEEFLIIFPLTEKEEALAIIDRIRKRLMKEDFGIDKSVTFSSGLSGFPDDISLPGELDELIKLADERLYEAKRAGKNRDVFF